jgi:arylsulfatase A-like enzyme
MKLMYHFKSTLWLLVATGLTATFLPCSARSQTSENRPSAPRRTSILLIIADDLGYGDLGSYGQRQIQTPNLDQLAQDGMRFTSAYAGGSVCAPSRAALMTGLHSGHGPIRGDANQSLGATNLTIAELLNVSGYRTGAIGKWGLGEEGSAGVPGKKGFQEWLGFLNQLDAENYYPQLLYRSDRKGNERRVTLQDNQDGNKGEYANDLFTDAAGNFLRLNVPDKFNQYRPFFLYLAYTIPHANNGLARITGNGMEVPSDAPYSSESWPQPEKSKAAMITRLDAYVGRLLKQLKDSKMEDNTVVIFTSDNGPHQEGGVDPAFFNSAGGLRGFKRDLHEGGIRVPLIVRWPHKVAAGTTSDLPCALWDFLPTAAEIARLSPPPGVDGISILPTLLGKAQTNRHEFLYWESHEPTFKQAVRLGDWKALRAGVDGPLELYNLKTDPAEKINVADKQPEVVSKIEAYLKTARTADERWPAKTVAENAPPAAAATP